jgi:integrase/recombinase XerD
MSPLTESGKFHGYQRYYQDPIPIALKSGQITDSDAELIKSFIFEHSAESNLLQISVLQISRILINCRKWSGPYSSATLTYLHKIIEGIKNDVSRKGVPYSPQTQREYISRIKMFFSWLVISEKTQIPLQKIAAVKSPALFSGVKSASDLLTQDEVLEIINSCNNSRNRAFFSMLYEGGFRVGEVATVKWGDLKFEPSGIVLNVMYKTEKPRYIRLVMSKEALSKWKSDYPFEITDDAYVFLSNRGGMLHYHAVVRLLDRTVKLTTIKKKVNLHLFRHSRVTHLIQQGVSESVIKLMMWGSINTRSFATYTHLAGVDVDREIYKLYGLDETIIKSKEKTLEPKICPNCKEICGPTSRYCSICGQLLNDSDIKDADSLKKWLMENKNLLTQFLNNCND